MPFGVAIADIVHTDLYLAVNRALLGLLCAGAGLGLLVAFRVIVTGFDEVERTALEADACDEAVAGVERRMGDNRRYGGRGFGLNYCSRRAHAVGGCAPHRQHSPNAQKTQKSANCRVTPQLCASGGPPSRNRVRTNGSFAGNIPIILAGPSPIAVNPCGTFGGTTIVWSAPTSCVSSP